MAKNSISQVHSGNGSVRSISNPCGNVGTQNQPSWGERTPKPQGMPAAPATGPVVGQETKAHPLASESDATSAPACDAGAESPNDVGAENKS